MEQIARLIGIVPTYEEGPLAATAIRSLLPHVDNVVVFEGPAGNAPNTDDAHATDFSGLRKEGKVIIQYGAWDNEASKRNAMVQYSRRFPTPTWAIYLDADEIMLHAECVRDLIWSHHMHAAEGHDPVAIPVHVQEIDGSVGRIHRIIRMDMLERHVLSMSQLQFKNQSVTAVFPDVPVWRPGEPVRVEDNEYKGPPLSGTPFIHHRSYLRPPRRGEFRLHAAEVADFTDELRRLGIKPEQGIPVHQDPGLIVAREQPDLPCDHCGLPRSKHEADGACPIDPYAPQKGNPFGLIGGTP